MTWNKSGMEEKRSFCFVKIHFADCLIGFRVNVDNRTFAHVKRGDTVLTGVSGRFTQSRRIRLQPSCIRTGPVPSTEMLS